MLEKIWLKKNAIKHCFSLTFDIGKLWKIFFCHLICIFFIFSYFDWIIQKQNSCFLHINATNSPPLCISVQHLAHFKPGLWDRMYFKNYICFFFFRFAILISVHTCIPCHSSLFSCHYWQQVSYNWQTLHSCAGVVWYVDALSPSSTAAESLNVENCLKNIVR